jgi:hypothetical protein
VPCVRHELRWADETRYVPISPRVPGLRGLAGVAGGVRSGSGVIP